MKDRDSVDLQLEDTEYYKELNVPVDKTVIFPSWLPSGDRFISENAELCGMIIKVYRQF